MTALRLACPFTATWQEWQPSSLGSVRVKAERAEAKGEKWRPSFALALSMVEDGGPSPELSELVAFARERGIPTVYDPDHVAFATTTPILFEHRDPELGRLLHVERVGDGFTVSGWLHPDHADEAMAAGYVSPLLQTVDAELGTFGGEDALIVTRSAIVELSIARIPIREGTSLTVGAPRPVKDPTAWAALQQTPGGAFGDAERFTDKPWDRISIGFAGQVDAA